MVRAVYRPFVVFAGLLLLLFACCSPAASVHAATPNDLTMQAEDERAVTWTLNADKVTSLGDNEVLEATGNVVLQRGGEYLKADYARYYASTKWVFLRGNVDIRMGKDTMRSEEAEFDLRSRVGWLKRGQIFMDGPHMYLSGDRINKHWGDVYSFTQAKITVCDGDVPAWSLEAEEAVVEIDGYAQLWRPRFQIKDLPVLVGPWMVLPAKKERQTGLLTPEFGQSSQRGFYYNQPFFWAIDESRDLTLNEYFMGDRGLMQGVQYRSRPSVRETAWVRLDWLRDSRRVLSDGDDPVNKGDGLVRTNRERFWLRGMYEGHLADPKWKLRADLDLVSDQNMLHEFSSGYSGYQRSRTELFDLFHRDIQEKDLARQSGFMLFRDWDRVSVSLSALYTQNQSYGHGNRSRSTDPTVQYLPRFDVFLHKGAVLEGLPLEVAASAEAGYLHRERGTKGMRYVMTPLLSLPVNGRYGSLIATAGVRQSFYGTNSYEKTDRAETRQDGDSQTVPTFQADGSTELTRTFSLGSSLSPTAESIGQSEWTALRHSIQPRLRYRNIPLEDQSRNPYYDSGDRIRPLNDLTYSVANILTRKRTRVVAGKPAKGSEEPTPVIAQDYLEFLRLNLEQSYDLREAERTDERGAYERRPFGDLIGEMTLSFDEFLSFSGRAYWSPYLSSVTRYDSGITVRHPVWGHIYTGVGYRREMDEYLRQRDQAIRTVTVGGSLNLYGPFSLGFSLSHDYERNENVDRELRLIYTHQCFQIMGIFSKDFYEEHYGVRVAITGLGE
ncbi:MAG: LPS assembly protein LptD [Deltaproteobacteria bacterium]|jgi:LPS-assembly protein|nr:LPS assembly protein LptD [Deltaproteobacteria bacterium]